MPRGKEGQQCKQRSGEREGPRGEKQALRFSKFLTRMNRAAPEDPEGEPDMAYAEAPGSFPPGSFHGRPLSWAALAGHVEVVKALLAAGASVNQARTVDGTTPLHAAAATGHAEVVAVLLEAGADVDAKCDDGATALHVACARDHPLVVRLLLKHGADPATDWPAMHPARSGGRACTGSPHLEHLDAVGHHALCELQRPDDGFAIR